jgi:hypothetical protein
MTSHDDGGWWIESRRKRVSAADVDGPSTDLLHALDESLQIAEPGKHHPGEVPHPAPTKPRARRAAVSRFPPGPREVLIRRVVAAAVLAAAALAVGWLVAWLFGG